MLPVHIFRLTAKHGKREPFLDELVPVDTGCDGRDQALGNVGLSRFSSDLGFLLISQLDDVFVTKSLQVVHFDNCLEDREAVLDVGEVVVSVDVDAMDLDLVAGARYIDQIVKHKDLLLAGHSARWHSSWGLLDGQFLIVTVNSLNFVDGVWATHLTDDTGSKAFASLHWISIENGTFLVTALASEVHLCILREHLGAFGDDATELNEGVEMHLAQFSEFVLDRQICDSDVDAGEKLLVVGVDFLHDLAGYSVEDGQHVRRFLCKPNGHCWLLVGQVREVDFKGLLVVAAHFGDAVLINVNALSSIAPQEGTKGLLNECNDFFLLDPLGQLALHLTIVIYICHVAELISLFIGVLSIVQQGCTSSCSVLIVSG